VDRVEDLVGGLGPEERARVLVPGVQPSGDVGGEVGDGSVHAALKHAAGELGWRLSRGIHERNRNSPRRLIGQAADSPTDVGAAVKVKAFA
jgi:hypothetical protein